jgi:hypothetical protein
MSEPTSYEGSCHCGGVKLTAKLDLSEPVTACNCSICDRAGWFLAFVPESAVEVKSGRELLTDYQFGKKHIHHTFCKVCGMHPFGYGAGPDGTDMYAVNVRCLEGVDRDKLKVQNFDGKSL